jgi:mannose-6-phosphate isomerase-like protein (cupin superfamily)
MKGMPMYDPLSVAKGLDPFDFHGFAPFNDSAFAVFRGDGVEVSDWEMHPDTDELLMVLQGSVTVEILTDTDSVDHDLVAGQFVVVPRGRWHRHRKLVDLVEMYFTPGQSLQSTAADPREPS